LDKLIISEGVYYKPKSKNFGALDSILRLGTGIYLFQMTISQDHPVRKRSNLPQTFLSKGHSEQI
jgi:hypothetical protein